MNIIAQAILTVYENAWQKTSNYQVWNWPLNDVSCLCFLYMFLKKTKDMSFISCYPFKPSMRSLVNTYNGHTMRNHTQLL